MPTSPTCEWSDRASRACYRTDGGQVYRDSIVWTVPRLEPGEGQSFRFGLKANTSGRRVIVASVLDARKMRWRFSIGCLPATPIISRGW